MEKRPREYASEIMQLSDRSERINLFNSVPEHLKKLVKKHCEIKQKFRNREKKC